MHPQHEAQPAQRDGMLAGRIGEHDTFSCTISLSNPIHILFPLCNCPFSPAFWSGGMVSWMMLLHGSTRQLGGLPCPRASADPRRNAPHHGIWTPGDGGEPCWGNRGLIQTRGHSQEIFFWINTPGWLWKQEREEANSLLKVYVCPYALIIKSVGKMKADKSPKSTLAETSPWWKDRPFTHTWHSFFCALVHSTAASVS